MMLGGMVRGEILWLRERHKQALEWSGMHILEC